MGISLYIIFCLLVLILFSFFPSFINMHLCMFLPGFILPSEVKVAQLCPTLATPWTVAFEVPPSMGFSRQEYWSGLPFPSPGDLPNPGIEPMSPALQADSLPTELGRKPIILPGTLQFLNWLMAEIALRCLVVSFLWEGITNTYYILFNPLSWSMLYYFHGPFARHFLNWNHSSFKQK